MGSLSFVVLMIVFCELFKAIDMFNGFLVCG